MRKQFFMFTILLWVVMSYGCSNQQDSTAINEKLEMIIEDEVISKEDPGVTEEILADGMDLSSYAQIPDNAIQEFWSWSEGRARVGYDPDGGYSYWKVTKELAEEYITFLTEEMV